MDAAELAFAGIARQAELVRAGEVTSRELVECCLGRIERLNPTLNAFRVVLAEKALVEADERDAARSEAEGRPLHGVPVAVKDEMDVEGELTTFGGASQTRPAAADSEIVRRLREAGAVIIGKTTMSEFGQWPFTESAAWGYTRNPWDPQRTPAGSSGGTAAAVASGMVGAGTAGDGGGSIRTPAACCGLFGLKPQRGRVSAAPAKHLWVALGTIGPLARSVIDSALFYDAVRGSMPGDRWLAAEPRMPFVEAARTDPGPLRIGVAARSPVRGVRLGSEQRGALESTADLFRELGHEVAELESSWPETAPAFVPQVWGGVRDEALTVDRPDLLERRTKQMLALARLAPEPVVEWAIRRGERIAGRVNRVFERFDLLLTPTIPEIPRGIGALDGTGILRAAWRALPYIAYTAIWNVCGNPAAAVPAGLSTSGLPLSVQLVGRLNDEPTLISVAAQLEAERGWADRRPPVS